jgi:hypothetical protein
MEVVNTSNSTSTEPKKSKRKFASKLKRKILGTKKRPDDALLDENLQDTWGIAEVREEYNKIREIAAKCDKISTGNYLIASVFQPHQEQKLTTHIKDFLPSVLTIEESIRVWLEAIVLKKWSLRHDALLYLNKLDSSISIHEYQVDMLSEMIVEVDNMLTNLSNFRDYLIFSMTFNEVSVYHTNHISYIHT